jgi:hypothetical protein
MLPFFRQCLATQTHFVVRAAQNRRVQAEEDTIDHLLDRVRAWPSQGERPFEVPASHGRQTRQTTLQISFGVATLLPPWNDPRGSTKPLPVWVVRVWELDAPEGEEALEWILLTSLETATCEHAWQRVDWYRCRWIVEEYHQCLKTGCRLEERSLRTVERVIRLLGLPPVLTVSSQPSPERKTRPSYQGEDPNIPLGGRSRWMHPSYYGKLGAPRSSSSFRTCMGISRRRSPGWY